MKYLRLMTFPGSAFSRFFSATPGPEGRGLMPKGLWRGVEFAALFVFFGTWAVVLANYKELPATVPTHFGLSGKPDGFSNKSALHLLLATKTCTFALLSAAPLYPNLINVPGERTPENRRAAIAMTRVVKLEVTAFFLFLAWSMAGTAQGRANGLGAVPGFCRGPFQFDRHWSVRLYTQ